MEMIDRVNLNPDIVTYGVLAMGCVTREQASKFKEKLNKKGIR